MSRPRPVAAAGRRWQAAGNARPLPPRQARALAALLVAPSVADAARETGVPERTLRRWVGEDTTFRAELRAARVELRAGLSAALRARALEAVDTLATVMGDASSPAASRVSAARTLLELTIRDQAEDLAERMQRLEALLGGDS
jgi:hypothetical protein